MRDDAPPEAPSGSAACAHCGLPVAARRSAPDRPPEPAYCCVGCRLAAAASGGQGETKFLEARLLLAAFLAMGCMEFSLVLYGDSLFHARADDATGAVRGFGRIALVAFSLPVLLLLAPPLLRGAWQDLRARRVRTDGLVVLAIGAAWTLSAAHSIRGTGEVYFETATMLLVLFAFGRRLEAHARTRGRDAAKSVLESLPDVARRVAATGEEESVPHDALRAGDRVRVAPGAGVPADVVVEDGRSEVRAAHVTGESAPRSVGPGDEVPAGAVNGTGALTARVLRPSSEGTIGRILALLDAPLPPTRTTRMIDRLAVWLTAVAVLAAALGGWRSYVSGGWGAACTTALSVLVVACPCALGLATPLAYRAIRAALARHGVLVRDPAALEVAATVRRVLLDKTGTLTDAAAGRLELEAGDAASFGRMSALVRHSGHALAHTVAAVAAVAPARLVAVPGAGVTGELDGIEGRAGSPDWMDREGMVWDREVESRRRALDSHGVTLVAYAEAGRVTALGAVRQQLRPGAAEAVRALRDQGLCVEILSGDRHGAVGEVAEALGADGSAALRPEDKVARVRALQAGGERVLMAGDGANDAPALRAADVGVAMACGTAAARSQAQVDVLGSSLAVLPALTLASRALRRTVRGNLVWNVVYNTAALTLAATGNLHPLVAVAAMIASSLTVSARSYRLLDWRGPAVAAAPRAGPAPRAVPETPGP